MHTDVSVDLDIEISAQLIQVGDAYRMLDIMNVNERKTMNVQKMLDA